MLKKTKVRQIFELLHMDLSAGRLRKFFLSPTISLHMSRNNMIVSAYL